MIFGGKHTDAANGKVIEILNPATGQLIDTVPIATEEDVERCVSIAQEGKKIWAATPLHKRSEILCRFADLMASNKKELAELECREMGKRIIECEGEVETSIQITRGFIERANHLYGETLAADNQPGFENDIIFTRREPLGVVACIVPFNYPIELCSWKISAALIMGNAIIVKPASDNPLAVMRLVELLLEAGVPGSAAQVITGRGSLVGKWLISNPGLNAVSLTGSTEAGIDVCREAAENLHRVLLELGGNDPLIVFEDADLELALEEAFVGRIYNAGQTCCATKRILVQNSIKAKFADMLAEKLSKVVMGDPMDRNSGIGSLISEEATFTVGKQIDHTVKQGAKLFYGGKREGAFYQPTILTDVTPEMDIAKDLEVFGPVFPIIGFDTPEEAAAIANGSRYGLNSGVMTSDIKKAMKTASQIESGTVTINGSNFYRHKDHAFGGYKMSGIGREGISVLLEEMSQVKTYALKGILA